MNNFDFILGDCTSTMSYMDDNSVDIVITDPPYNVGKDYGVYKDNRSPEEYYEFMSIVIHESKRIARKGIIFYVGGKLTKLFFELIPGAHLIIVNKRATGVMDGNYFLQYHSMFSTVKPVIKIKDLWDDIRLPGEGYFFREERYDHPGLTSLKLTKKIILSFTNENETILDPFLGVGTTGVACYITNRNCIGIEINPDYLIVAQKRLDDEKQQMRLYA
jgi:site-specific DNA-methyltransferase (adenine-specific)